MGREYRKLIAWQRADELVMEIYKHTKQFPKEELYGITSQLRRAALSVPTNIAEGMARRSQKDRAHFLVQAEASLSEVGYLIDVANRLGYLASNEFSSLSDLRQMTAKILYGLRNKLDKIEEILTA